MNNQPAISPVVTERIRDMSLPGTRPSQDYPPKCACLRSNNLAWWGEGEEGQDLTSNDFIIAIITTLTELKKSFTREVKEGMAMLHQMKNINKEIEIFKEKNQVEILELKSTVTAIKNLVGGLNRF